MDNIYMIPGKVNFLGRAGESVERKALFKIADLGVGENSLTDNFTINLEEGWTLIVEQDNQIYPQLLIKKDEYLEWSLVYEVETEAESGIETETKKEIYSVLATEGMGRCQAFYLKDNNVSKSAFYYFSVGESLPTVDTPKPPTFDSWLDVLTSNTNLTTINKAIDDLNKIEELNEKILSIESAAEDIVEINEAFEEAKPKIEALNDTIDLAEAWAVGTKNKGETILGESSNDGEPGSNNNAKYYAGEASNFASDASSAAGSASRSATAANTSAANASSSASQAANDAYNASLYMEKAQSAANSVTDYNNKYNEVVNKYNTIVNLESDIDKDVEFIAKNIDAATNAASAAQKSAAAALTSQQAAEKSESNSTIIKEEITQLKTDTESIKEEVNSAKNAAEAAQEKAEAAQEKTETAQGAAETAQKAAEDAAERAEEAALGNATEILKGMIDTHNKAEDAHENRFSTIEEQLKKAGTADTIIASTPSSEEGLSLKVWKGTKEEYKEIITKDPNTLYIVVPEQKSLT